MNRRTERRWVNTCSAVPSQLLSLDEVVRYGVNLVPYLLREGRCLVPCYSGEVSDPDRFCLFRAPHARLYKPVR